jgi:hypothetical protein
MFEDNNDEEADWEEGTNPKGPVLGGADSFVDEADKRSAGLKETEDPDKLSNQHVNEFLTELDRPSPDQLEDLVNAGTPEAWEELRRLADQYDILVDDGSSPKGIAEKIRAAMDNSDDMVY